MEPLGGTNDHQIMFQRVRAHLALIGAAPLSVLAAAAYVAAKSGFGRGDLPVFAFWSVLLVLPLLLAFQASRAALSRLSLRYRALSGFLLGAVSGVAFTVALALGMGPMIGSFSFPILYIWTGSAALSCLLAASLASVLLTQPTTKAVVTWSTAAILSLGVIAALPMLLILGSMNIWGRARREVYLLPPGFEGPVFVLFDQSSGAPLPIVDGKRELRVPSSGVLLTSSPIADGWKKPEVYYVGLDGSKVAVRTDWALMDTTDGSVRTYWLPVRTGGTLNGVQQPSFRYEAFVVGQRSKDAQLEDRADSVLDSLWHLYAR